jgi:hypothetical protein
VVDQKRLEEKERKAKLKAILEESRPTTPYSEDDDVIDLDNDDNQSHHEDSTHAHRKPRHSKLQKSEFVPHHKAEDKHEDTPKKDAEADEKLKTPEKTESQPEK